MNSVFEFFDSAASRQYVATEVCKVSPRTSVRVSRVGVCCIVVACWFSADLQAQPVFYDDFETGARASGNVFSYTTSGANVFVEEDPVRGLPTIPFEGTYSLGFSHRAKDLGSDSTAQQNFRLSGEQRDVWFRYFFRVPDNFFHREEGNNKWFHMWTDEYEAAGVSVALEYWPDGEGGSVLAYRWIRDSDRKPGHQGHTQLIRVPEDRGKWVEFVYHVRLASELGVNDGVIQTWVRKEGESDYTQLHNRIDAPLHSATQAAGATPGLSNGYIMGWANSGFSEETTFYIDNFQFANESLLDAEWPTPRKPSDFE